MTPWCGSTWNLAWGQQKTGLGLFAAADIAEDTYVIAYYGKRLSADWGDVRSAKYKVEGIYNDYLAQLSDDIVIDATFVGNYTRYVNYNCRPNVATDQVTLIDLSLMVLY